jgi:hypothetical protein
MLRAIPRHIFVLRGSDSLADHVPIALLGVELESKASWISCSIRRALLPSDSRETCRHRCLLANLTEEIGRGDVGDIVRHRELAERTCAFCMNDSLGDPLAIEMGKKVDKVNVLNCRYSSA